MRQRQKRTPVHRSDVQAFIRHRGGDRERCRKALKYIYCPAGLPKDIAGLRELRDALFAPDERAWALDRRIADLERGEGDT